ncbi:hypothetical protein FocTR4_00012008 [Fusarium oxysporum f. sp. cubense]|uniref:Uncharacterized protein n=1 Tax=Fusarium oxysporum f. sp. cubense TaxID=61366 RepID=A0A5C6SD13_FUSOC|nr:hypothetical protein FocTR4_00012008 [Fusarium oxysporum f. sp. cubense]
MLLSHCGQVSSKSSSLGLYYNSPEPAIIYIKCGFAINPIHAPRYPGNKHYLFADERARLGDIREGHTRSCDSAAPASPYRRTGYDVQAGKRHSKIYVVTSLLLLQSYLIAGLTDLCLEVVQEEK